MPNFSTSGNVNVLIIKVPAVAKRFLKILNTDLSYGSCVINAFNAEYGTLIAVYITVDTRLYVINTYTSFGVDAQLVGTENNKTPEIANGIHIRRSHGLALPNLDFVRSTITPMMISLIPSKNLDIIMIVPTAIAFTCA